MIRAALFGLGVALAGLALPATAQTGTSETSGPALLVADQVYVTPQRTLVAEGQVEALQDGIRKHDGVFC